MQSTKAAFLAGPTPNRLNQASHVKISDGVRDTQTQFWLDSLVGRWDSSCKHTTYKVTCFWEGRHHGEKQEQSFIAEKCHALAAWKWLVRLLVAPSS
eukprot:4796057-Amphidinium_carterae.1